MARLAAVRVAAKIEKRWKPVSILGNSHLFVRIAHRQKLRHVLSGVGKLSEINEISMERLVVGHAFVGFPHALKLLNRLDEAAVFVENLLDLRRARRRRWSMPENMFSKLDSLTLVE